MGKISKRSQPVSQYFTVKRLLAGVSTDSTMFIAGTTPGVPTNLLPLANGQHFFLETLIMTNSSTVAHSIFLEDGYNTAGGGTAKGTFIIAGSATGSYSVEAGITFGNWYPANSATAGAMNGVCAYDASGSASNPTVTISGYLG